MNALPQPPTRLINRELSWLAFNARVIDEAFNAQHPLLERLHFLAISAANLDEFYMVRISGLRNQMRAGIATPSDDGLSPQQQMAAINSILTPMIARQQQCWQDLRKTLAAAQLSVIRPADLDDTDKAWLHHFFCDNLLPLLTPIAVDPAHPFPFIANRGVALVLQMRDPISGEKVRHLVPLPGKVARFVKMEARAGDKTAARYLLLEQVIILFVETLIPGFVAEGAGVFRVLRNSDMAFDDRAEDLLRTTEHALKKRQHGEVIRLSIHSDTPEALRHFLKKEIHASDADTFVVDGMNGLADLNELVAWDRPDLRFAPYHPRQPERLKDYGGDAFAAIRAKDMIVHHPYESFDVVVHFLRQAAADAEVLAIKQTLYRTSADSPIVNALIEAAHAGKSVTALVELKARFDEAANIRWARDLEQAGVHVIYGFVDLKTHAKLSLVVRREDKNLRCYMHVGTGNYHPLNALFYTDLSFFTCDAGLARDMTALFHYMTSYAEPKALEKLAFAPLTLRQTLLGLISSEIAHAKAGKPAAIWLKLNALVDRELIEKLYEASEAGVNIELIIRGVCCLQPGVPGQSSRIRVRSLIGRFLEHSRILCFGAGFGLPHEKARVFISSADWMPRNLDRRIEVLVQIENPTVHQQLCHQILIACLKDNTQSWLMQANGDYHRLTPAPATPPFSAHTYFMHNPSLSGRGSGVLHGGLPPQLELG